MNSIFFQVDKKFSRFHQFDVYFVSNAKYLHHAFDLF